MICVEGVDWEILRILKLIPMRNIDIVNQLGIDKGTVSKSISAMEMMGLIKRDKRILSLTKTGIWYAEFYEKVRKNRTR